MSGAMPGLGVPPEMAQGAAVETADALPAWRGEAVLARLAAPGAGNGTVIGPGHFGQARIEGLHLAQRRLEGCTFEDIDWTRSALSELHLSSCRFINCHFRDSQWHALQLRGCEFLHCTLDTLVGTHLTLEKTRLAQVQAHALEWSFVQAWDCTLEDSALHALHLYRSALPGVRVLRTRLADTLMQACSLAGSHWEQAVWSHVTLVQCTFDTASCVGLQMEAAELRGVVFAAADLRHSQARALQAQACQFSGCDLREATWPQAVLNAVSLAGSDLSGMDLTGAQLCQAGLREVKARQTRFGQADCRYADFSHAELAGADFREARMEHACLHGALLQGVQRAPDWARCISTDARLLASELFDPRKPEYPNHGHD